MSGAESGSLSLAPWQRFVLSPLPHGHGPLRPASAMADVNSRSRSAMYSMTGTADSPALMVLTMTSIGSETWWKKSLNPAHR
jgi:hypothetical protein